MDKKVSNKKCNDKQSACEIIELAINDIDTLTKAFQTINAYCQAQLEEESIECGIPDYRLH